MASKPKRNIPRINYYEGEEPSDDRYVYCDFCDKDYVDSCTNCGALVALKDNLVPMGTPNRAIKTVPKGVLEVRSSSIHGLGVFSLMNIKAGVKLGPYVGKITRVDSTKGYSWKLRDGHMVDAADESISNYMRYVNCSRNASEQNLIAFQYQGSLYYRTCRNIRKHEELLVHYGSSYAKKLGIDSRKYFEPETEEVNEFYCCQYCHIGLSTKEYRDGHEKYCKFRDNLPRVYNGEGFKCEYCHYIFSCSEYLQRHQRYCRSRNPNVKENEMNRRFDGYDGRIYACKVCCYRTKWKYCLKMHTTTHNVQRANIFKCDQCNFKTYYRKILSIHLKKHLKCHLLKCPISQKGFITKQSLDYHTLNHHPECAHTFTFKLYNCQHCKYKTVRRTYSKNNNLKHSKENVPFFNCNYCKYTTYRKNDLIRQSVTHSGNGKYICSLCKCNFNRKIGLDSHIFKHHPEFAHKITSKFYNCQHCEYKTVYQTNLKRHNLKYSKENVPFFNCNHCKYTTYRKDALITHLVIHSGNGKYICSLCKCNFNHKISLDSHTLKKHLEFAHTITSKMYNCQHCEYKTVNITQLKQHNLKHSKKNVPFFNCNHCKYTTYRKNNLIRHSLIHSGNGKYICSLCKCNFNQKIGLDSHTLKKHPEFAQTITSKLYNCQHCEYKTVQVTNMKQHNLKYSKENVPFFNCNHCKYTTCRKGALIKHSLIHSGNGKYICRLCKCNFNWKIGLDSHTLKKASRICTHNYFQIV